RIEQQDVSGSTSTHILTEVAHRLMLIEASTTFGWPLAGTLKRLQRHPAEVQKLVQFRQATEDGLQTGIRVLTIDPPPVASPAAGRLRRGCESANWITQQRRLDRGSDAVRRADESRQPRHGLRSRAGHHALLACVIRPAQLLLAFLNGLMDEFAQQTFMSLDV